MMNEIKKNELNDLEMENVTGGESRYDRYRGLTFLTFTGSHAIWDSLTPAEQNLVIDQCDDRARRKKMVEIWKSKTEIHYDESGAYGGW